MSDKGFINSNGCSNITKNVDLNDEKTREQLAFSQQWHFALEIYNPSEQIFSEKTLWTIKHHLTKEDCVNCSLKENCQTKNGPRGRRMIYSEKEIRLCQRRQYECSAEFQDKYRYRARIEGTNSRFIHMTGARRVRYRGQENVGFSETMKALVINMFRVNKYVNEINKFIDSISNNAIKNVFLLIFIYIRAKIRILCEKY